MIGTVVFGANPVLAQEQVNAAGANTETVEPGQGLSELPKEASSGDLAHLDKDLAGKSRLPSCRSCQPRPSPLGSGRTSHTVNQTVPLAD